MAGQILPSSADGQWYLWTPSGGPLVITFADTQNIRSVWIPAPVLPITCADSGGTFYALEETGAELIPIRPGQSSVTLTGTASTPTYVYATSVPFNPFKEVSTVNLLSMRMQLSGSDYTPISGADMGSVKVIPWSPVDDVTDITWNVVDIFMRAENPGSTTTTVRVEYSTGAGGFSSAGFIDASGVSLASGVNESARPTAIAVPQLNSGVKVRLNFTNVGTSVDGVSVYLILEQAG